MGGALALHFGYRFCTDLAGVFALSSFLNENSSVYEVSKGVLIVLFWVFSSALHSRVIVIVNHNFWLYRYQLDTFARLLTKISKRIIREHTLYTL